MLLVPLTPEKNASRMALGAWRARAARELLKRLACDPDPAVREMTLTEDD